MASPHANRAAIRQPSGPNRLSCPFPQRVLVLHRVGPKAAVHSFGVRVTRTSTPCFGIARAGKNLAVLPTPESVCRIFSDGSDASARFRLRWALGDREDGNSG